MKAAKNSTNVKRFEAPFNTYPDRMKHVYNSEK